MTKVKKRQLMRLLHGELPADEACRLEQRLEHDPELSAAYRRLARAWDDLELPPAEVPAGFSTDVVAAARKLACSPAAGGRGAELSWSRAPVWARAGAAAALVTGVFLGATLGSSLALPVATGEAVFVADADSATVADADVVPFSLAEAYWLSLEESGGLLAEGDGSEGLQ